MSWRTWFKGRTIPAWLIGTFWLAVEVLDWLDRTDSVIDRVHSATPMLGDALEWAASGYGRLSILIVGLVAVYFALRREKPREIGGPDLRVSVEIVQPPWSKNLDHHGSRLTLHILDRALITNCESGPVSLVFDLRGHLMDAHPYVIPERGQWDEFVKTPDSIHDFLRGPLYLAPGESAEGDLGFVDRPGFPHGDSEVDVFSLRLVVTDVLSGKSRTFELHDLHRKWTESRVRVRSGGSAVGN